MQSLEYFKQGFGVLDPEKLGDEYILNLAGDIATDFGNRYQGEPLPDLVSLTKIILPYMFQKNHDLACCDLLVEIEQIPLLY